MYNINYNVEDHIELFNYKNKISNEGKSLLKEDRDKFLKLNIYNMFIEHHILWESRLELNSLLEAFLNNEISSMQFHDNIFEFRRNQITASKKFISKLLLGEIKEFSPNKKSYKLKGFLTYLYSESEGFEVNWNEENFYISIKKGFIKFQKILNEN